MIERSLNDKTVKSKIADTVLPSEWGEIVGSEVTG
jgi:hypothetical protein